jgi:hypothetical protein
MKRFVISFMDTFVIILAIITIGVGLSVGMAYPHVHWLLGAVIGGAAGTLISGMVFGVWMLLSSIHDQLIIIVEHKKSVDKHKQ